jgi:hypothetical protein
MTSPEKTERDDIKTSIKAAAVLGAAFTVIAFATHDSRTAISVGLGAAIAVANLVTMRAIVRALLRAPEGDEPSGEEEEPAQEKDHRAAGKRGGAAWGIFAVLKILVLFGGIWFLLSKGLVAPIPLVVGYGVLPLGIAAAGLWNSLRPRP